MLSRIYFQLYAVFSYSVYEDLNRMRGNELMFRSNCRNNSVIQLRDTFRNLKAAMRRIAKQGMIHSICPCQLCADIFRR